MLVLASQSPSRKAILSQLPVDFRVHPAHIDETPRPHEQPAQYVERMAREKALKVQAQYPDSFVLGADTIVSLGRRILRKAQDANQARQQIQALSGRRHRVWTALCLARPDGTVGQRLAHTHVRLRRLDAQDIDLFIDSKEWKDVSVYRHEGLASFWIENMTGQASTIAGLPAAQTYGLLKSLFSWPQHSTAISPS